MMMKPLSTKRKAPTPYSEATALKVLENIADGSTMEDATKGRNLPSSRTVRRWMQDNPDFRSAVADARRISASKHADELLAQGRELYRLAKTGRLKIGQVAAYKELAATVKFLISRWSPEEYGEKVAGQTTSVRIYTSLRFDDEYVDPTAGYTIDVDPVE